MVDTGIFATTAEVQKLAGTYASTVSNVEAYINTYMTMAESYINSETRINYSDTYTSLNADVKGILKMTAAALAALMVINYDRSGFTNQSEAQAMVNLLWTLVTSGIAALKDKKTTDFISGA